MDITERKKAEAALRKAHEEMERLAVHDELTGLYNRRELMSRLAHEVQRSQRYQHSVTLLILDLDHFKAINATPDEPGAALLTQAASQLRLSARGYHRVLKVARTLADLEGQDGVSRIHIAEALSYRRITLGG